MSRCLIALGSNLGDRETTLESAVVEIESKDGLSIVRRSRWYKMPPVGMRQTNAEFLNGAVLCQTTLEPQRVLDKLLAIEGRHGRKRQRHWGDRTLDLDLLLYDDRVIETPTLVVPHPRMSFRRFVLEPAVEIAGELTHSTIGWSLARLLQQLNDGADCVAIISPDAELRERLVCRLAEHFSVQLRPISESEAAASAWPAGVTRWVFMKDTQAGEARLSGPKLTVLLDSGNSRSAVEQARWAEICREPGRGPTLHVGDTDIGDMSSEVLAAVQAVWPALGPRQDNCLQ
jgi:2-amino-4-hydroxy-6-hydroxymethyldihydropteridine diphosphokinase